jgi:hypothetical protein
MINQSGSTPSRWPEYQGAATPPPDLLHFWPFPIAGGGGVGVVFGCGVDRFKLVIFDKVGENANADGHELADELQADD